LLHLTSRLDQGLRQAIGARCEFFNQQHALIGYLYFAAWDAMLAFMAIE
jgi:hypothetical protein